VEKTVKDEAVVGLHTETAGGHVSTRSGALSAIAAALHFLVHPRKKAAVEASAVTGRTGRPERDRGMYRSPMEAGITGGFSLLMDNSNTRRRR
jgi:hypothetical protein